MEPHQVSQSQGEQGIPTGKRPPISPRARPASASQPKLPGRWFTHLLYVVNGLLLLAIVLLSLVLLRSS